MKSKTLSFDTEARIEARAPCAHGALDVYRSLLAGALRGETTGSQKLAAVIAQLPDEVALADALDEHWKTVEDFASPVAFRLAREAQADLAAAFECRVDALRRSTSALAEAFAQNSRQLEALLECLPAMTYLKDDSLTYLFVDESFAALLGRTGSQVASRTDRELFPPAIALRFEELDREALKSGLVVESVDVMETTDGPQRVRSLRSPVTAADGRSTSLLGVLFKEADAQPQAIRAGRQVAQVAHELRTPLTAVKEAIAVVQDGVAGELNPRQKDFTDIAARNCVRLQRLLECAIELERLCADGTPLTMEERRLREIVEASCDRARPWTHELSLTASPHDVDPTANVDAEVAVKMVAELIILASQCSASRSVKITWRSIAERSEVVVDCDGAVESLLTDQGPAGISQALVLKAAAAHNASTGVRLNGPFKGVYIEFPAPVDYPPMKGARSFES